MDYDLDLILNSNNIIGEWSGDDFFMLKYFSKRSGKANEATDFIIGYKENDENALSPAIEIFLYFIKREEQFLKNTCKCRYIVTVPSHEANETNMTPCEQAAIAIGNQFNWLTHIPDALIRTETVQKAARARPGARPTSADHLRTISYKGPIFNDRNCGFILLDDVYTRGDTSLACRQILKNAIKCNKVMGMFLSRTQR